MDASVHAACMGTGRHKAEQFSLNPSTGELVRDQDKLTIPAKHQQISERHVHLNISYSTSSSFPACTDDRMLQGDIREGQLQQLSFSRTTCNTECLKIVPAGEDLWKITGYFQRRKARAALCLGTIINCLPRA